MSYRSTKAVAVFAVAALAVTSACSSSKGSESPGSSQSAETYTFHYPSWMWEEGDVGKWLKDRVATFEAEHSKVTVQTTQIGVADYENQISTQLSAGQAPDLMTAFTNQMPNLIENDLLAPLDSCFEGTDVMDRVLPTVSAVQRDGKTYGVPLTMSPQALVYNKDLMDAAGVTAVPTTPDELLEASRKIKEATGKFGYAVPTDTSDVLQTYIESMKWILGYGSDWSSSDGKITANEAKNIEAIETLKKFYDEDLTPKGMNESDVLTLFAEGGAAFLIEGPWAMTQVQSDNPDLFPKIGFAPSPTPTHVAITGGAFWAIPKDSAHFQDACDLMKINLAPDAQRSWLESLLQIPGTKVQPSEEFLKKNPWVGDMADIAAKYPGGLGYAPPGYAVRAAEFQQIAVDSLAKVFAGSASVKDALEEAQKNLTAKFAS